MAEFSMYPELDPVEVGEWLRFESTSMYPDYDFVQVSRLTKKLIWIDDGWQDGKPCAFSRKHGAMFDVGCFDAYAGRVRKLTDEDKSELAKIQTSQSETDNNTD